MDEDLTVFRLTAEAIQRRLHGLGIPEEQATSLAQELFATFSQQGWSVVRLERITPEGSEEPFYRIVGGEAIL